MFLLCLLSLVAILLSCAFSLACFRCEDVLFASLSLLLLCSLHAARALLLYLPLSCIREHRVYTLHSLPRLFFLSLSCCFLAGFIPSSLLSCPFSCPAMSTFLLLPCLAFEHIHLCVSPLVLTRILFCVALFLVYSTSATHLRCSCLHPFLPLTPPPCAPSAAALLARSRLCAPFPAAAQPLPRCPFRTHSGIVLFLMH